MRGTSRCPGCQNQTAQLDKLPWKYQPGDDQAWANPQFDDREWETLDGTAITLDRIPKSSWRGLGWFRSGLKAEAVSIHVHDIRVTHL